MAKTTFVRDSHASVTPHCSYPLKDSILDNWRRVFSKIFLRQTPCTRVMQGHIGKSNRSLTVCPPWSSPGSIYIQIRLRYLVQRAPPTGNDDVSCRLSRRQRNGPTRIVFVVRPSVGLSSRRRKRGFIFRTFNPLLAYKNVECSTQKIFDIFVRFMFDRAAFRGEEWKRLSLGSANIIWCLRGCLSGSSTFQHVGV